jgi:hypothetical protein
MIASAVGACEEYTPDLKKGEKVKSPGVLYKHYSPRCKTLLYTTEEAVLQQIKKERDMGARVAVLCENASVKAFEATGVTVLNLGETDAEEAQNLYALLRKAESVCDVLIALEPSRKEGVMAGVLNRLRKACSSEDIQH